MISAASYLWNILVLAIFIANSEANLCKNGVGFCLADLKETWGYRGFKGPLFWGLLVSNSSCYGSEQSPIDIDTDDVEKANDLLPATLTNYNVLLTRATVENNGHTIEVVPEDDVPRSMLVNGQEHSLVQFHFHWGCNYDEGSEHTINGKSYAMEIHFVHRSEEDGKLAVLGVLVQEVDEGNEEFEKIASELDYVKYKNTETPLRSPLNLMALLPQDPITIYRYDGSLTTPPCSEGVTWSVAKETIKVGSAQMDELRKLYSAEEKDARPGCKLSPNYRPVQPLKERKVYESSI